MIWIDQTLGEGLRIGMDKGNVHLLVQLLHQLQVEVIDIAVADWQKYHLSAMKMLPQTQIRGRIKATMEEVQLADALGVTHIVLECAVHPEEGLTKKAYAALLTAQKLNMNIGLCIENASQFSIAQLEGLWRSISTTGVTTLIYSDGDSLQDPLSVVSILAAVVERIPIDIEYHAHNVYGLATANALAAMQAGVKRIATAVAGVGLPGHAATEEVIMACKWLLGAKTVETAQLSFVCSQILSAIGIVLPVTKAIIGQDIFAHESGIHVDGVIKNPQLYEAFPPEEVGLSRKLIIGKHSGTASIQAKFQQWNVVLTTPEAQYILKQVRKLAVIHKKAVDDDVLWHLYKPRVAQ